jgi:Tfp pilus assembly protein PilO
MTMDHNRLWLIGAIVVMGAVLVLGWFLGISPQLDQAAAAAASRGQVEQQNHASELKIAKLKQQFENIDDLQAELAGLRGSVPNEADIPAFVGQLNSISKEQQVELTGITVSDGQPYDPPAPAPSASAAPAAAGAAVEGTAGSATPAPSSTPAGEVATPAAADPGLALITADNFVAIPVSVTVKGDYGRVLDFIEGVQTGTRLVLVTGFSTSGAASGGTPGTSIAAPAVSGNAVTGTVSAYVYVLLDAKSTAPAAAATPSQSQAPPAG